MALCYYKAPLANVSIICNRYFSVKSPGTVVFKHMTRVMFIVFIVYLRSSYYLLVNCTHPLHQLTTLVINFSSRNISSEVQMAVPIPAEG